MACCSLVVLELQSKGDGLLILELLAYRLYVLVCSLLSKSSVASTSLDGATPHRLGYQKYSDS